jgi:hypothetical protein
VNPNARWFHLQRTRDRGRKVRMRVSRPYCQLIARQNPFQTVRRSRLSLRLQSWWRGHSGGRPNPIVIALILTDGISCTPGRATQRREGIGSSAQRVVAMNDHPRCARRTVPATGAPCERTWRSLDLRPGPRPRLDGWQHRRLPWDALRWHIELFARAPSDTGVSRRMDAAPIRRETEQFELAEASRAAFGVVTRSV